MNGVNVKNTIKNRRSYSFGNYRYHKTTHKSKENNYVNTTKQNISFFVNRNLQKEPF